MLGHVNELLVKAIDQNKLDMPMTAEDKDRFVKFLVSEGYLDATTKTYKAIGESGRQAYDTNALLKAGIGNRFRSVAVHRRHGGGPDLPAGRRHGPVPEGAGARDRRAEDFARHGSALGHA